MSLRIDQIDKLLVEGAGLLLSRTSGYHYLGQEVLVPRLRAALEKYLLRDNPEASRNEIRDFINNLQADDLCLIVACEQGNEKAWNDLVERFSTTVRSAARAASSNEESAEDLSQSIWAELYGLRTREDGKPTGKLAYYSGRGSLAGWLRAVVAQLAVDQHRKQSRFVQTEEDGAFDRMLQQNHNEDTSLGPRGVADPEAELSEKLAGAELQKALSASIKQLSAEDRLLIKLYYFDDLRLREAGALLGVHEATASRRLTRIHADLRQRVQTTLIEEKGWTKPETERAFSVIAIHLEADVESSLTGESRSRKKENRVVG
ncbi:MAG: RNA polymerase sigma factor [Pyrinomonadaceae bacterium]